MSDFTSPARVMFSLTRDAYNASLAAVRRDPSPANCAEAAIIREAYMAAMENFLGVRC